MTDDYADICLQQKTWRRDIRSFWNECPICKKHYGQGTKIPPGKTCHHDGWLSPGEPGSDKIKARELEKERTAKRIWRLSQMIKTLRIATILTATLLTATFIPSAHAGMCGPHDKLVAGLKKKYSEVTIGRGLHSNGQLVELFAAPSGSFTIAMTSPTGTSCLISAGEVWEAVTPSEDTKEENAS